VSAPSPRGPRLRELGLRIGRFEAGPSNAITDIAGVTVGHVTVWRDEPQPPDGRGIARTGVTAVLPALVETLGAAPVPAGTAVLNGAGELTSSLTIAEWGLLDTPVYLTSTHAVGRVYDGAVEVAVEGDRRVGEDYVVIPVVGECDDSWLSEARVTQVEPGDVRRAVVAATAGAVPEGAIGAGTR
jgi:D-aminopeptidase